MYLTQLLVGSQICQPPRRSQSLLNSFNTALSIKSDRIYDDISNHWLANGTPRNLECLRALQDAQVSLAVSGVRRSCHLSLSNKAEEGDCRNLRIAVEEVDCVLGRLDWGRVLILGSDPELAILRVPE